MPAANDEVRPGDLLYQLSDLARPASTLIPDQCAAFDLPGLFCLNFLGVALERSPAGKAEPIHVATAGAFEYPVLGLRDWRLGDLVGPMLTLDLRLVDQSVRRVETNREAIGRCARRQQACSTVLFEIVSAIMHGGIVGRRGGCP